MPRHVSIHLRHATEQDAAAVLALWNEAFYATASSTRQSPYGIVDFSSALAAGHPLVADQDGVIAGAVVLYESGADPSACIARPGELEISRLAVAATRRRRGVARALLSSCHAEATRRGRTAIVLWNRPAQVEAHQLYRKLSYERVPERDSTDQGGRERCVYRIKLSHSRLGVVPHG
jgi:ribosomal protein S18 acetylase RimI-like enzyme